MRPIIGMLADINNERAVSAFYHYTSAIEKAGGVPVVIPFSLKDELIHEYVDFCDGFFFTGGVDIDPLYYGEEAVAECGEIHPYRDSLEFLMFDEVMRKRKPIIAVCRGAQLVNVALGGTLYQDINSEVNTELMHRQAEPTFAHSHTVNVIPDTPLAKLFPEGRVKVNSFHHQAIKIIGRDLIPMATADDGIIEAFYYSGDNYIRAYQWHPERLYDADDYNKKAFEDFILVCRQTSDK